MEKRLTNAFHKFGTENTKLILQCADNEIVTTALIAYNELSPEGKQFYKTAANNALIASDPLLYNDRKPSKYFNANAFKQVKP